MGKGDKKSKKGKIFRGSYGNVRPRKTNSAVIILNKKETAAKEKNVTKKKTKAMKKTVAKKKTATKK